MSENALAGKNPGLGPADSRGWLSLCNLPESRVLANDERLSANDGSLRRAVKDECGEDVEQLEVEFD